jgi:hypothetical protein
MEISAENPPQDRSPDDEPPPDFAEAKACRLSALLLGQDSQEIVELRSFAVKPSAPDVDLLLVQREGIGRRTPRAWR